MSTPVICLLVLTAMNKKVVIVLFTWLIIKNTQYEARRVLLNLYLQKIMFILLYILNCEN